MWYLCLHEKLYLVSWTLTRLRKLTIERFVSYFQANITRTNHIMFTMGTDFKYQYANSWFRQLDKFIHYVNKDGRVNALYSTPSIYTDAKYAMEESWPLKTGDFFP
ncbi:hypothetical protein B296_00004956 [Ensete ventricosum]|uniref:Glycoside hydrolase family 38 N-terminal domain-containing protein n=1 Tax=Ensete ventricosum TaxID=4639 RepID=A0A427B6B7_ENSVE|nr:hypothetical protein B296_00004956 [Ensete ventricosum]